MLPNLFLGLLVSVGGEGEGVRRRLWLRRSRRLGSGVSCCDRKEVRPRPLPEHELWLQLTSSGTACATGAFTAFLRVSPEGGRGGREGREGREGGRGGREGGREGGGREGGWEGRQSSLVALCLPSLLPPSQSDTHPGRGRSSVAGHPGEVMAGGRTITTGHTCTHNVHVHTIKVAYKYQTPSLPHHGNDLIVLLTRPLIEGVCVRQPAAAHPPLLGFGGQGLRRGSAHFIDRECAVIAGKASQTCYYLLLQGPRDSPGPKLPVRKVPPVD